MSGRNASLLLAVALVACSRPAPPSPPLPASRPDAEVAEVRPSDAAAPIPDATDGAVFGPWPALVRDEQWDEAWRALEALSERDRARAEIRYVRARVALYRGDDATVPALLDGLESALPLLADDIARRRAEAKLAVGPFAEAGAWFSERTTAAAQLDAARAFEKAKDLRRARAAADRVIGYPKRTRAQEAEARALRVRIADPLGDTERDDARWLVLHGADLAAASDALALVARVDPSHPLSAQELLVRAHTLSDAGRTDDALHAIDLSAAAPGAAEIGNADRGHARGMALYHARGRSLEAAKTLTETAGTGGPNAAEDAFHAARALSRADHDEEAIRAYEDVRRRFASTRWAQHAAFYSPYLRMLHGEWRECARGFDAYLHAYAHGDDVDDARRDGALCKLLDGRLKEARAAFEHLVEDERDPLISSRMADMAALAAQRDGDLTHAVARWTDVARTRPLSWAALVARARLVEAGAPVPPAIDPAESPPTSETPLTVSLPPPAGLLHTLGLEADAELALRDREGAVTTGAAGRSSEALCMAYSELGRARRRFQISQSLPSSLLAAAPSGRSRWAWECAFPAPYAEQVRAAEAAEKLPEGLIWAVMRQESGFDPDAVSPARAVGLMQLLPETAAPIAELMALPRDDARLTSPPYAIRVAARALHDLLDRFHGVVPLAVAAYNGGAESVERWLSRAPGMQLDDFVERIPFKETRDYVGRVMGNLARYGYLARGEAGVPQVQLALPK